MGLDIWYKEDVTRILASTLVTMTATMNAAPLLDHPEAQSYQRGFRDALRAVAIAFGVRSIGVIENSHNEWSIGTLSRWLLPSEE